MLPEGSGNYAGDPNEAAVQATQLNNVDKTAACMVSVAESPFTGPTATEYTFEDPCYLRK